MKKKMFHESIFFFFGYINIIILNMALKFALDDSLFIRLSLSFYYCLSKILTNTTPQWSRVYVYIYT